MNRWLTFLLLVSLVTGTACTRNNKANQLAALDNAYHAGLLTKDEYDAKRAALTGSNTVPAAPTTANLPANNPPLSSPSPEPEAESAAKPERPTMPAKLTRKPSPTTPPTTNFATPPTPNASPAAPVTSSASASTAPESEENKPSALAGCDDAEYKSGGQKGSENRFFAAAPESVRRAAISALDILDFNIRKNSNKEIEGTKKRHVGAIVGAGGERVILTFKKVDQAGQSGTLVTGETKKSFIGHLAQRTWTDAVLSQMACILHESAK